MRLLRLLLLAVCVCLTDQTAFAAFELGFASNGQTLTFDGFGNLTFSQPSSFTINSGPSSVLNLSGTLTGTYTIGTIDSSGTYAPLTTANGQLQIVDSSGVFLANVNPVDIYARGTGGNINVDGTVNFTVVSYTGSNAGLTELAGYGGGVLTISTSVIPGHTLSYLAAHATTVNFAGNVYAVPEPFLIGMFPAGLLGFLLYRRRSRT